jgi:hypothetical protein
LEDRQRKEREDLKKRKIEFDSESPSFLSLNTSKRLIGP